jgi:hypothetical protein
LVLISSPPSPWFEPGFAGAPPAFCGMTRKAFSPSNEIVPVRTARPNAKDDLKARALELRAANRSVNDIALELGVARSTAWNWVGHIPLAGDRAERNRAHSRVMTDARWGQHRVDRDATHAATVEAAAQSVGDLTERELLLIGAAIYWCEGAKSKPWREYVQLRFTNSDPALIDLFIRFVELTGFPRRGLTYRVAIHESADVAAAEHWWSEIVRVPRSEFRRATVKTHRVKTSRYNTGDHYHGCLVIEVPRSRELYWRVEGVMKGLVNGD